MTKKQWIVLVVLLFSALVPVFSSGKRSTKVSSDSLIATTDHNQSLTLEEESRSSLAEDPDLIVKADRALSKLSILVNSEPEGQKTTADDILKVNQLPMPLSSEEVQAKDLKSTPTPKVFVKEEETLPIISESENLSASSQLKSTPSFGVESVEMGKLKLQLVALQAKLDEQSRSFESRAMDLKSRLDIQESENVKLSHQIQNAENHSVDAQKLSSKIKDLESKLEQSQTALAEEKKRGDDSKVLKSDFNKRIAEEQKIRKSIEEQLELAVKKRDEQGRDNDKLRRVVGDFEKRVKLIEEQRMSVSEDKEQVLLKQLASIRKELTVATGALEELKKKQKNNSSEAASAQTRADELQKQLEARQRENDELAVKLATAERINEKSRGLQQELLESRNELMLAQEQVRTLMSTSKSASPEYQSRNLQQSDVIEPPKSQRPVATPPAVPSNPASDYLTVEVTAQKAALRAGAGEENSIVMEIQQGSRLMVETREGDWYRVITPKGQRAYLRADLAVELDASGRPRFSVPSTKSIRPGPRSVRPMNSNPPDSDPLVELLGRQLKDRAKAPASDDSLSADGPNATPGAPVPTGASNGEDEMEAFETLKKGMAKETPQ